MKFTHHFVMILASFICSHQAFLLSTATKKSSSYQQETVLACLQESTPEEAHLLLNLIYASYQRSKISKNVHVELLAHLQKSWQLWHNCSSTRLNPSHTLPHPGITHLNSERANKSTADFLLWNKLYAAIAEECVKGTSIRTSSVKEYIRTIRAQARFLMAQAALVAPLAPAAQALLMKGSALQTEDAEIDDTQTTKSIISEAVAYLESKITGAFFAKTDKKFNSTSNDAFEALLLSQQIGSQLWEKIETARSEWYYEQYTLVYGIMKKLNFPPESFHLNTILKELCPPGPHAHSALPERLPAQLS